MIDYLKFLTENKAIILGAATVIAELIVIVFNTIKIIKSNKMNVLGVSKTSKIKHLLWVINPINVFRKF